MHRSLESVSIILALLACLTGCSAVGNGGGSTAFEVQGAPPSIIAPPTGGEAVQTEERIDYIPAYPLQMLEPPAYPPGARRPQLGDYALFVTLTVDEQGKVTEVAPSWQRVRAAHPDSELFLQAVRAAVARWQLSPAHQVYWRRVPGGEDQYLRTEAVPETMEIKFSFQANEKVQ